MSNAYPPKFKPPVETVKAIPNCDVLDRIAKTASQDLDLTDRDRKDLYKIATHYVDRHSKVQTTVIIDLVYNAALRSLNETPSRARIVQAMWAIVRPVPSRVRVQTDEQ